MYKIGNALAQNFLQQHESNKVVVNLCSQINNNCGFNLANFKPNFIRDYFEDVLADYERSFIGAFAAAVCSMKTTEVQLYCSITKFEGHMGYSLATNSGDHPVELAEEVLRVGTIPEYVPINQLYDFYQLLT